MVRRRLRMIHLIIEFINKDKTHKEKRYTLVGLNQLNNDTIRMVVKDD